MDIMYIGKIRELAMKVANGDCRWTDLSIPMFVSIGTLEGLFFYNGIIDVTGEVLPRVSYHDIMFTICLYYSMRPTVKFTKKVY